MTDVTKFISGCMSSLSAMVQLEVPHVNILSKMDLVANKKDLEEWDTQFSPTAITLHVFSICLAYFNCSICSAFLMFQFLESGASSFVIRVESTHGSSVCKAKQIFGWTGKWEATENPRILFWTLRFVAGVHKILVTMHNIYIGLHIKMHKNCITANSDHLLLFGLLGW